MKILEANFKKNFFYGLIFKKLKFTVEVNIFLEEGEGLLLVGKNGSGKTTTLKTLSLIFYPDLGEIVFQGKNIISDKYAKKKYLENIRYTSQFSRSSFDPSAKVIDSIAEFNNIPKSKAKELIFSWAKKLKIQEDIFFKFPAELSEGEIQVISLLRALCGNPKIIYLDEPFDFMDPLTKEEILRFFLNIKAEKGFSFIISTHDPFVMKFTGLKKIYVNNGKCVRNF